MNETSLQTKLDRTTDPSRRLEIIKQMILERRAKNQGQPARMGYYQKSQIGKYDLRTTSCQMDEKSMIVTMPIGHGYCNLLSKKLPKPITLSMAFCKEYYKACNNAKLTRWEVSGSPGCVLDARLHFSFDGFKEIEGEIQSERPSPSRIFTWNDCAFLGISGMPFVNGFKVASELGKYNVEVNYATLTEIETEFGGLGLVTIANQNTI